MSNAWRRYWQWYGVGYGLFQASMAVLLVVSGLGLVGIPIGMLLFDWR